MKQLGELRELLTKAEREQVELLAISPDPPEKNLELLRRIQGDSPGPLPYRVLSDADHAVIDRYGLLNEQAAAAGRFVPHPATYLIDKQGKVIWRFVEVNYKIRPANEVIRDALRKAQ